MRAVEITFHALRPGAALAPLGDIDMAFGRRQPFERGQRRLLVARPHIGPDHAVLLDAGIGRVFDLVLELRLRRLVRHVDAIAVEVVCPAVIPAAQSASLVLAEEQRRTAMRAMLGQQPDLALGRADSDQILGHEAHANRRAAGLELARQQHRRPITPQQLTHHGAGTGLRQQLMIFELHRNTLIKRSDSSRSPKAPPLGTALVTARHALTANRDRTTSRLTKRTGGNDGRRRQAADHR
jgi:hypothetical protein